MLILIENRCDMKYVVRAIKYFFYYSIIFCLILGALVALKLVEPNVDAMFRNGYDSLWQIAIIIAVFAGAYPAFGFARRTALVAGTLEERRQDIIAFMDSRAYSFEKVTSDGGLAFRRKSVFQRCTRMCEDRVIIRPVLCGPASGDSSTDGLEPCGFEFDGLRKDIVTLAMGLETRLGNRE